MNSLKKIMAAAWLFILLSSCSNNQKVMSVFVANSSDIERSNEMVKVDLGAYSSSLNQYIVIDEISGKEVRSQLVDADNDSVYEAILFQASLKGDEIKEYIIKEGESSLEHSEVRTFARFVPERTDDFTWENDRVAFRVYGPKAQQMVEQGVQGGTLSGGVDCWLKKVDYSIIDKWYKGNAEKPGYYHIDHGEGLDNYHVGPSLGCGGTGVMFNENLITSINYTGYEVLANGPVQTQFVLKYAPYKAGDEFIHQKKNVSINLGDNLTKFVIEVEGTDTLTTGITLHDNQGVVSVDSTAVWASYWAPHFKEQLGTSIVVDPKYFAGYSHVVSETKDKSHLLVHLKVIDGKVEYYSGFAWSGSKQFNSQQAWESYLLDFTKRINNPLKIEVK